MAANPITGVTGAGAVTALWVHLDDLYDFAVNGRKITTTEDHPFWSVTDQRWEDTQDLAHGELVLTASGRTLHVTKPVELDERVVGAAYNLTVDDLHTYHVGADEILVHNCDGRDPADGGLDNNAFDRIDDAYGPDVAAGVDYQVQRMHDGSPSAGDHEIPGIGHDPDALASYFASWQGKMTHTDTRTGSRVAFDADRGVLIVSTGYNTHGYKYSQEAFDNGRYVIQ